MQFISIALKLCNSSLTSLSHTNNAEQEYTQTNACRVIFLCKMMVAMHNKNLDLKLLILSLFCHSDEKTFFSTAPSHLNKKKKNLS